jgi:hypothetical protein
MRIGYDFRGDAFRREKYVNAKRPEIIFIGVCALPNHGYFYLFLTIHNVLLSL